MRFPLRVRIAAWFVVLRRYVIVAALSSESVDRSVGRLVRLLVLGGSASLLFAALAGWWLARRALRPIEVLTNTAEAIGVDRLADRVSPGPSREEVAHLANTINTMLDRIQHGVLEQRAWSPTPRTSCAHRWR